jgi:hypothetical protein
MLEQRHAPRTRFDEQILLHYANQRLVCRAVDLSAEGIAFKVPSHAEVHAQGMRIFFPLGRDWVAADAVLAREAASATGRIWGARFLDLPEEVAAEISWRVGRPRVASPRGGEAAPPIPS